MKENRSKVIKGKIYSLFKNIIILMRSIKLKAQQRLCERPKVVKLREIEE